MATQETVRVIATMVFTRDAEMLSKDDLERLIADQEDRIQRAREAAQGVSRLEFPAGVELVEGDEDDETQVLVRQHGAGAHADGLREGCPLCSEERDLEELGYGARGGARRRSSLTWR
mgnify:CR=1 FL=1